MGELVQRQHRKHPQLLLMETLPPAAQFHEPGKAAVTTPASQSTVVLTSSPGSRSWIKGECDLDADTSDFRAPVLSTSCCLKKKKEEMGKAVTWTLSRFSKDGKGGISISTLKFCTRRH